MVFTILMIETYLNVNAHIVCMVHIAHNNDGKRRSGQEQNIFELIYGEKTTVSYFFLYYVII